MLIKNELLKITPPKSALDEVGEGANTYYVYATVKRLEKCGRILAVFVYDAEKGNLILRFFSDKKNFIICEEDEEQGQIWKRCKLQEYVGWFPSADYYNNSAKKIEKFLDSYSRGLNAIDRYISDFYAEARCKAKANKQKRIKEMIERCKIPKRLGQYCDKYILTQRYIFISKSKNNKRTAVCSCCGNTFDVSGVKHRQDGKCPSCKTKAIYWLDTYKTPEEKIKICIPHKLKEGTAMQYIDVYRIFKTQRPEYVFDDYYYIFENEAKQELRPYKYNYLMGEWKDSWVMGQYEETYLYTPNVYCIGELSESIKQVLKKTVKPFYVYDIVCYGRGKPEFIETLIKNNMFALAADHQFHSVAERAKGKTFEQIFGVSGQYRTLYSKLDVRYGEHIYIKRCDEMLNEDYILKLRRIVKNYHFDPVEAAKKSGVTFKKYLTYMTKQMDKQRLKSQKVYELWRDYLGMCKQLRIDTKSKSIKFPPDVRKAHDEIQDRIKIKQSKADLRAFKKNTKKLYEIFTEFAGKEFEIHLPGERADFLREGQQLGHCVGKLSMYYENHKKGKALIIFVRKTSDPDTPFFTLELDAETLKIKQLRGKGNCSAPPKVTAFVNKYIKHIKNKKKEKENAA